MNLRRWIVLIVELIAVIGIVAAAYFAMQPPVHIAALPTLASLPSATPSPTPTATPVVVVEIVTATPIPATATPLPPTSTLTPTPTVTFTATITPSMTITDTITPSPTKLPPTLSSTLTATSSFLPITQQTYYVTVDSANLRVCPRHDCSDVAPLTRGQAITVVGYTNGDTVSGSNVWFYATELSYQGYVHSSLVALTMPATIAIAPPTATPTATSTLFSLMNSTPTSVAFSSVSSGSSSGSSSGGFLCADGTTSHAAHRQGACSYHGGIAPGH